MFYIFFLYLFICFVLFFFKTGLELEILQALPSKWGICHAWPIFAYLFETKSDYVALANLNWNSLDRSGWPGTHKYLPASTSQVLVLQECTTMPSSFTCFGFYFLVYVIMCQVMHVEVSKQVTGPGSLLCGFTCVCVSVLFLYVHSQIITPTSQRVCYEE